MSERSALTYFEGLRDIGPEDMEAACKHALETSQFMPVVATIRQALEELKRADVGQEQYSGPPQLAYPAVTQAERDEAIAECAVFTEKLKAQLGKPQAVLSPAGKEIKIVPAIRTHEQAKAELERRGYLTGKHDPRCLCPTCRQRRERI